MRNGKVDDIALRRAYVVVLVVPLMAVALMWAVRGPIDAFTHVLYPAVVVTYGALLAGFMSRLFSLRVLGSGVFLATTSVLVARVAAWEIVVQSRPEDAGLLVVVLAWFSVCFALAFVAYGTRRGAVISLVSYSVLYLWTALSMSGGMLAGGNHQTVVGMAGAHAALIAVVWVLARNIEHLSAAHDRVDLLALEATTDPLTGIANRRRLDDELQRLIAQSHRHGRPLSAILIDLDHFKDINDRFGHAVGDEVLVQTVDRLHTATRNADLLGRWGGEEFLLLASDTDNRAALAIAERCRRAISRGAGGVYDLSVTASLGVATLQPHDDARALMRRADLAMYNAKSDGRDRVVANTGFTGPPACTVSGPHSVS